MGNAVLQKFPRDLPEARLFVQPPGIGLGLDGERVHSSPLGLLDAGGHDLTAQPLAALPDHHPAQASGVKGHPRWEQPQVGVDSRSVL